MQTVPCVPSCLVTPQVVNTPGIQGLAGPSAFTTTTADFVTPAAGSTVTINVVSSIWAVIGQIIIIGQGLGGALAGPGPATFQVTAIPSTTTMTVKWVSFIGDVATGSTISAGAVVSTLGALSTIPQGVYAVGTGTAYTLTTSSAQVIFGTGSPAMTLGPPGAYALFGRARFDYVGATITNQSLSAKLRRTNNTAADVTNSSTTYLLRAVTTDNTTACVLEIPMAYYTTTSASDFITLWANISGALGAGSITCVEATILAIRVI